MDPLTPKRSPNQGNCKNEQNNKMIFYFFPGLAPGVFHFVFNSWLDLVNLSGKDRKSDETAFEQVTRLVEAGILSWLPANSEKKGDKSGKRMKIPVKCNICRKNNGKDTIFDLRSEQYDLWLHQHLDSAAHIRAEERHYVLHPHAALPGKDSVKLVAVKSEKAPCTGLNIATAEPGSRMSSMQDAVIQYATMAMVHTGKQLHGSSHTYNFDLKSRELRITHKDCLKSATIGADGEATCHLCRGLADCRYVIKNAVRFQNKMMAAELLNAAIFNPKERTSVEDFIRSSSVYTAGYTAELDKIMSFEVEDSGRGRIHST